MKLKDLFRRNLLAAAAIPGVLLAFPALAQNETVSVTNAPPAGPVLRLPSVIVTGWRADELSGALVSPASADRQRAPDTASLLEQAPGAAVVRNGPQTGIVQLRGLSGDRVRVLVDGMTITPACPNHMDPPLHYAAPSSVRTLSVMAGVTPVSWGGDSVGGTVLVEPAAPRFATNNRTLWFGEAGSFYHGSDDGYGFNGQAGVAEQGWSVAVNSSWQTADDLRFPGGRVRDTGYEIQQHGLLAALRTSHGVWALDGGVGRTCDAGTPALPMDMIKDDSHRVGLRHEGDYSLGAVQGRVYYHAIDHLMDNYSLRPLAAAMRMSSPAESEDVGAEMGVSRLEGRHTFSVGTGFHLNRFDAYQRNDVSGAVQDTLNEAQRTRVGTYIEWQADWNNHWMTLLGVRNDTVLSDAANVGNAFPAGAADRTAFNARVHDFTDANFDVTAAVRFSPGNHSTYELAFARKNRAPSLLERYLWTPLSASAGQADGRTYLGNLDLDSETSHQVSLTGDWHGEKWQIKATPFYNFVDGYIQGTPISRLDGSGNSVLQFNNLGRADLCGVDGEARLVLNDQLAVRGTVSYVRGINRDNDDNLYRIAPLRGTVNLDHQFKGLKSTVEVELVDAQDKVAAYNGETRTPGYVLLHLRAEYTLRERLALAVALENVLDQKYTDHLGGINRVLNSDVAVGAYIPGAGRFVSTSLSCRF